MGVSRFRIEDGGQERKREKKKTRPVARSFDLGCVWENVFYKNSSPQLIVEDVFKGVELTEGAVGDFSFCNIKIDSIKS